MKRKKLFIIIGIPVILVTALIVVFAQKWIMVEFDYDGLFVNINIWYLTGKEKHVYEKLDISLNHSLPKFSKIKDGMEYFEVIKVAGKPTSSSLTSIDPYDIYKLGDGWFFNVLATSRIGIEDYPNKREFMVQQGKYGPVQPYLSAVAQSGGSIGAVNAPKRPLAKFSKIKLRMKPAEAFELVGKPIDTVGTDVVWYRYKIDKGWYFNLQFTNGELSDMSIVDYPNRREFVLVEKKYTLHPLAAAQTEPPADTVQAAAILDAVTGILTDTRDGKTYRTVKIGNQTWMAENLNYPASASFCYKNKKSNCKKYGRLYTWDSAMKACPGGWHLPGDAEWDSLALAVGGTRVEREYGYYWEHADKKLKSRNGWKKRKGGSGNGTDDYGFSALPGGYTADGRYYDIGRAGTWWSATECGVYAWEWAMYNERDSVYIGRDYKMRKRSVRCVADTAKGE